MCCWQEWHKRVSHWPLYDISGSFVLQAGFWHILRLFRGRLARRGGTLSRSTSLSTALPSVNFHNHVVKASIALPGFHRYLGTLPIPLHRHESAHSAIMDNLHTDGQFMEVDISYKELVGLFSQVRVNPKTLPYEPETMLNYNAGSN